METAEYNKITEFEKLDETPMMCAECCEVTTKNDLTEVESCPYCMSHKLFEVK